jgi:hypothetical protein
MSAAGCVRCVRWSWCVRGRRRVRPAHGRAYDPPVPWRGRERPAVRRPRRPGPRARRAARCSGAGGGGPGYGGSWSGRCVGSGAHGRPGARCPVFGSVRSRACAVAAGVRPPFAYGVGLGLAPAGCFGHRQPQPAAGAVTNRQRHPGAVAVRHRSADPDVRGDARGLTRSAPLRRARAVPFTGRSTGPSGPAVAGHRRRRGRGRAVARGGGAARAAWRAVGKTRREDLDGAARRGRKGPAGARAGPSAGGGAEAPTPPPADGKDPLGGSSGPARGRRSPPPAAPTEIRNRSATGPQLVCRVRAGEPSPVRRRAFGGFRRRGCQGGLSRGPGRPRGRNQRLSPVGCYRSHRCMRSAGTTR